VGVGVEDYVADVVVAGVEADEVGTYDVGVDDADVERDMVDVDDVAGADV